MTTKRESHEPSLRDPDGAGDALPITPSSLLLTSARARFIVAVTLSLTLWAGYFWATGTPTPP